MTSLTPAELHYDPVVKFSIEDRADRWQRRETGPWRTTIRGVGPIEVQYRYRRRRRIEFVRLDVAWHDLWTRAILRGALLPVLRRLARWQR